MAYFDLNSYQTVQERIDLLRGGYGESAAITMDIVHLSENDIIIKATLKIDGVTVAEDFAHEVKGSSNVNKTSWVENCATSVTGRVISHLGGAFSPKGAKPSREEMEKVQRGQKAAAPVEPAADDLMTIAAVDSMEALQTLWAVFLDEGKAEVLKAAVNKRKAELKAGLQL